MSDDKQEGMWDWGNGPTDLNHDDDLANVKAIAEQLVQEEANAGANLTPEQQQLKKLLADGLQSFQDLLKQTNPSVVRDPTLTRIWCGFVEGDPVEAVSGLLGYVIDPRRIIVIDNHWTFKNGSCLTQEKDGEKRWYLPKHVNGLIAVQMTPKEAVKAKLSNAGKQHIIDDDFAMTWAMLSVAMASAQDANDEYPMIMTKIGPLFLVVNPIVEPDVTKV